MVRQRTIIYYIQNITLYYTYPLLYYEDNIQETSDYNTIQVKTKNNNILQTKSLHSKYLQNILHYIILTPYYSINMTFRRQANITP